MRNKLYVLLAVAITLTLLLTGCGKKAEITVGSKIDTEGAVLSQMMILILRHEGFTVNDRSNTGQTDIVRSALINGEIDIYPEYTGNGAFFFNLADSPVWQDFEAGYQKVKELDKSTNNIVWLRPAPANNTWAIAIPKTLADSANLKTLDELAGYIKSGGVFKLAASEEFLTSSVALPAFQAAYGFTLRPDQQLVVSLGGTSATEKAAAEGTSGVNAAMAFGTDGGLAALGLVVLEDNRRAQAFYAPAPAVRGEIFESHPELAEILDPIFATLDLITLQTLNAKVQLEGRDAAAVAQEYLKSKGFLP